MRSWEKQDKKMSEEKTQEKIMELQSIEQGIQNLSMQKQQFQSQLFEIDSAISEIDETKEAYKIIGNIMVKSESRKVKEGLLEKKESYTLRVKSIENQEKSLAEKAVRMQKEVMQEIKGKKEK